MTRFRWLPVVIVMACVTALLAVPSRADWMKFPSGGGVAASLVCLLTGGSNCTMTGSVVFSGVPLDLTTVGNEDLTIGPGGGSGTGSVVIISEDNSTDFADSNGAVAISVLTETALPGRARIRSGTTGGALVVGNIAVMAGASTNQGATSSCLTVAEQITGIVSSVNTHNFYCEGAWGVDSTKHQSITISTGTNTTSPTSSRVELTCTTAPCDYQPGEASVVDGWEITVCNNEAVGGDNITITDNSGSTATVRTRGGSTITLLPGDCSSCSYHDGTNIWACR